MRREGGGGAGMTESVNLLLINQNQSNWTAPCQICGASVCVYLLSILEEVL